MTLISNKATVVAFVPETTEGTPLAPSADTQYTAVQADFAIKPDQDVNENAELNGTIGPSATILGAEKPTCTLSKYLRHSGIEGQAPDYASILEAVFGTKVVAGTEYPLTSGSTPSVLHFGSGNGVHFQKGQGVLIKDGTNGFRIRAIESVSGDNATLGFNLPAAPASGVTTGKCVLFKPAQSGHKSHSIWGYIGNGGLTQMMCGSRFTDASIQASAGGLINMQLTAAGLGTYLNPIEITSSTCFLDFTDDDDTWAVQVPIGFYKDPSDLADALTLAMNTASTGQTAAVTYDSTNGKFTILTTGTLLSLLFNSGDNTANSIATKIGFTTAADKTGTSAATGYTSVNAYSAAAPQTPAFDSATPIAAKNQEIMIGDASDYVAFNASDFGCQIQLTRTEQKSISAETGVSGSTITARKVTFTLKAMLNQYDVSKYARFRKGTTTRVQYSFGNKVGGAWVPGQCGYVYSSTAKITKFDLGNDNGLVTLSIDIEVFVPVDASGEIFIGLL